jgi:hypothetical protein
MSQVQSPPVRQRSSVNRCEYLQLVTRRCLADAWIGTYMQKAHICRSPTRFSAGALWTIAHSSVVAYCSSSPLDRLSWRPLRSPGAPTAIRASAGAGSFVLVEIIGGAKRGRIHRLSGDHEENSNRAGDCRSCRARRLWRHGLWRRRTTPHALSSCPACMLRAFPTARRRRDSLPVSPPLPFATSAVNNAL